MIQNIEQGSGFRGLAKYLFSDGKDAKMLAGTLTGQTPDELAEEAAAVRKLNPRANKVISHISLSLPPGETLADEQWAEVANKYIERMGYENCAWMAVRHHDTDHSHIHLGVVRIDMTSGRVVKNSWDYKRGEAIVRELEGELGLQPPPVDPVARRAPTRNEIRMMEKTQTPSEKLRLQAIIDEALEPGLDAPAFLERLRAAGVGVALNMAKTGHISGISFDLHGHVFKGSKLGKGYSWAGLQKRGIEYEQNRDLEKCRAYSNGKRTRGGSLDGRGTAQASGADHAYSGVDEAAVDRKPADNPGAAAAARGDGDAARQRDEAAAGQEGPGGLDDSGSAGRGDAWDAAAQRIGDLAADSLNGGVVGSGDAGDGAVVPAHIRKKIELWQRQAEALGAPHYRITLMPRREGLPPINLGKSKTGEERFWTAGEIARKAVFLSAKNIQGYDVYVTPIGRNKHYIVLDDTTREAIHTLKGYGAKPALVQESSPGNVQAIFRAPRNPDRPDEQQVANKVVQSLNRKYGDPRFSGVVHPFRMAGFGNAKPGKELSDGRRFFVRILESGGGDCPLVSRRLEIERERVDEAREAEQRREGRRQRQMRGEEARRQTGATAEASTSVWKEERRRQAGLAEGLKAEGRWRAVDESAVDYRTSRALLSRGVSASEVRDMMTRDTDIMARHGRALWDYCERTVAAAQDDLRRAQRGRFQLMGPSL